MLTDRAYEHIGCYAQTELGHGTEFRLSDLSKRDRIQRTGSGNYRDI